MRLFLLLFLSGLSSIYGQITLEGYAGVSRSGSRYQINQDVYVNSSIANISDATILIRNNGRLRFGPNAQAVFGEVDGIGDNGLPKVKGRVLIIEEANSVTHGVDNYNNGNARFQSGCDITLNGVTWISKTNSRSDFDIRSGALVRFNSSEIVLDGANNTFVHFASALVEINGLRIDNQRGQVALEFANNGIPAVMNGLDLLDNNPTSSHRHFVFINNTDTRYELDNFKSRNVSIHEGSGFIAQLNNPLANIPKGSSTSGVLEVHRDVNIDAVREDGSAAAGVRLLVERIGGTAYTQNLNLDGNGKQTVRLLQYLVPHGTLSPSPQNNYSIGLLDYNLRLYANNHTVDFVPGVNGENFISNVLLFNDSNITEQNPANAATIAGIAVDHVAESITVSANIDLCQLYDYLKWEKVNTSPYSPTLNSLAATVSGGTLDIGNYQLVITGTNKVAACDKFNKIQSNVVGTIPDPTNNLAIAFTDPNGSYKLVRLSNLQNNVLTLTDNNSSTELANYPNISGVYSLVTQSNSNSVSVKVTRDGYSNWAVDLDLSNGDDVFSFVVVQSSLAGNAATLANQESIKFLLQKMLQQSSGIKATIGDQSSTPINLTTNSISGSAPAEENQEEIIQLAKRILLNTTVIKNQLDKP
jgi:hypothetical protein